MEDEDYCATVLLRPPVFWSAENAVRLSVALDRNRSATSVHILPSNFRLIARPIHKYSGLGEDVKCSTSWPCFLRNKEI